MQSPWKSLSVIALMALPAFGESLPPLSLKELLVQVGSRNPEVLAARQAWKVKTSDIRTVGAWPDPVVSYIDERFPAAPGMEAEKLYHLRVEQDIPFPGKLHGDASMKLHEARLAASIYRSKLLDVQRDARMRYYQLFLTDQKIALATQTVEVLRNALQTAQSRLASGQSSASDVFMAQTELRKMENELFQQTQGRTLVTIELNTLLDQPTDRPIGVASAPVLQDLAGPFTDFQNVAKRYAPQYLAAIHEVNHSQSMLKRNRLEWAPDFGVMYERETAPGSDAGRQIGVSVKFPLWIQRPWSQSNAAREHLAEAQSSARAMENEVMKQVHSEYVQTETHLAMARRVEAGVLPSALSNLRVARQQYASGRGDFLRLLEALRTWLDAHNQYQDELYQYGEHWTELGRWTGVDVDQIKQALSHQDSMPEDMHEN